jgi:hypothetical protein
MFYIRNPTARWKRGIIPYIIKDYPEVNVIRSALEYIEDATQNIIKFADISNNPKNIPNYVVFEKSDQNFAEVGKRGKINTVKLRVDNVDPIGTVIHELYHIIGGAHEHQCPLRDNYIRINENNVAMKDFQFKILSSGYIFQEPYDFESISHYDTYAFSKSPNQLKTIEITNPENFHYYDVMGRKSTFSIGDINAIKKMYRSNG